MTCSEARRFLEAYLDSELDAEATARVNAHLEACEACAHRFRAEQRLEAIVVERLLDVPPKSEERFARILDRAVRPRRRRLLALGAVALVLLAAGLGVLLARPVVTLVDLARLDHERTLAGGKTHALDPALVAVLEPRWGTLPPEGYELVAAHPCRLGKVAVTYVGLRRDGRTLSLFDIPPGIAVDGDEAPGAAVVRRDGGCCVLVGTDALSLARRLAEEGR